MKYLGGKRELKKLVKNKMEDILSKAHDFAQEKHKGQKDDVEKDYFENHLIHVYTILRKVTTDKNVLSAALLHDTLEDTNTTYEELVKEFGKEIADLVNEVTHEGKKTEQGFFFPRLHSREAVLIKFADRLSNLSRMENWDEKRKEHYLKKSKFWRSELN